MQIGKSYGLLWRQHTSVHLQLPPFQSVYRNITIYTRRRQKRHLSGHAAIQGSMAVPLDVFPLTLVPPQLSLPFEWDLKGKEKAREEIVVKKEVEMRREEHVQKSSQKPWSDFPSLYAPGTSSISLKLVQNYLAVTKSADILLRMLIWVLDQVEPPTSDVSRRSYKWTVNLYRKSAKENRRYQDLRFQTRFCTTSGSIDILCAEILKKEVSITFEYKQLRLLNIISERASQRGCYRTLQYIKSIVTSSENYEAIRLVKGHVNELVSMQERDIVGRAQRGEWEQVWKDRGIILAFLRQKKKLGELKDDVDDEWSLDVILLKSLVVYCMNDMQMRQNPSLRGRVDLARDQYYAEQIITLSQQMLQIYGQISDRWLYNFILSLARGVEPGARRKGRTLTLNEYLQRLPLTELAHALFLESCQKSHNHQTHRSSLNVKHAMLALEMNWEYHCHSYMDASGRERMAEYARMHRNNIKFIINLLSNHEKQSMAGKVNATPHEVRRQVMENIKCQAIATHAFIRLSRGQYDWKMALEQCRKLLEGVHPDEYYYSLLDDEKSSTLDQVKSTAKAMMMTRRLMRGSLMNLALYLDYATVRDKIDKVPEFLQVVNESISKGWWDPWPLREEKNRKQLNLIKAKAHIIDPPAALYKLMSRLLGMCSPVEPLHRHSARAGSLVKEDGQLASTFWTVLNDCTQWHRALKSRLELLDGRQFLVYPQESTRLRKLFREVFLRNGSSLARFFWALFVDPKEKHLILFRLRFLMEEIFLPLDIPGKGWTSARIALGQDWPSHVNDKDLKKSAWDAFQQAHQIWREKESSHEEKSTVKAVGRQLSLRMKEKQRKDRIRMGANRALRFGRVRKIPYNSTVIVRDTHMTM